MKPKLIRITTVPLSLNILLKGQLRFMKEHFEVIGISAGPLRDLEAVGNREGVLTRMVPMTRSITPLKDLKAVWQLYWIFRKEKPTIVHTHTPKAGTLGMLAAKLAGVPNRLHTVAGLPLEVTTGSKRALLDIVEKFTYSCANKIYPNSPGLCRVILNNKYCRAAKLKVLGIGSSNGINTTYFDSSNISKEQQVVLKESLDIRKGDFVFVFVGRVVKDKGINELVTAFEKLSRALLHQGVARIADNIENSFKIEDKKRVKLLLVGPFEPDLDPLEPATLIKIEQNPDIISVGFQEDVRPYLAISNVLAFPSYREGFPNVVMQAGSMGLPCIVTDINGSNEIIMDGENGIIVPVKAKEKLFEAMKKVVQDTYYYEKLKTKARLMITSRFEQQVVWKAILEEYEEILRMKP